MLSKCRECDLWNWELEKAPKTQLSKSEMAKIKPKITKEHPYHAHAEVLYAGKVNKSHKITRIEEKPKKHPKFSVWVKSWWGEAGGILTSIMLNFKKHSRRTSSGETHSSYQIWHLHLSPKAGLIHTGRVLFVLASLWLCHPAFTSHNTLYDNIYLLKCHINL